MNTHQHTRTTHGPTNGLPMESRVTLAGPCVAAPRITPTWTRPVAIEPVFRSVIATKVMPPAAVDNFSAGSWTPDDMIAAVKRGHASRSFISRWHFHRDYGLSAGRHPERL